MARQHAVPLTTEAHTEPQGARVSTYIIVFIEINKQW